MGELSGAGLSAVKRASRQHNGSDGDGENYEAEGVQKKQIFSD